MIYLTGNGKRVDIDSIVRFSGYSSRHIQRIFRDITGMSLGEYIRRRRLTRAALLLRLTRQPIIGIALGLGFDSQSSFHREFRKLTGYSPRQYRNADNWSLLSLMGGRHTIHSLHELRISYMKGGSIRGQEILSGGWIPDNQDNDFMSALFSVIESTNHSARGIVRIIPTMKEGYHYQIQGCLSYPGVKKSSVYNWDEGLYFSGNFETTRETFRADMHHIYLSVLPSHRLYRRNGSDVLSFRRHEASVYCSFFIPVQRMLLS